MSTKVNYLRHDKTAFIHACVKKKKMPLNPIEKGVSYLSDSEKQIQTSQSQPESLAFQS